MVVGGRMARERLLEGGLPALLEGKRVFPTGRKSTRGEKDFQGGLPGVEKLLRLTVKKKTGVEQRGIIPTEKALLL